MAATTFAVECSESQESEECWNDVFGRGIENEAELNNQHYRTEDDRNDPRHLNNNINNNINNNDNVDLTTTTIEFPCDFLSLCRVVNELNTGFSILRVQLESVVQNLDVVSKTNTRIHDKVLILSWTRFPLKINAQIISVGRRKSKKICFDKNPIMYCQIIIYI